MMKPPTSTTFATVPTPIFAPSAQATVTTTSADADVRRAERERRVLGDPLVKDVPGREPELRLELEHDREREEEQADEERGQSGGEPTANAWRRVHAPTIGSDP